MNGRETKPMMIPQSPSSPEEVERKLRGYINELKTKIAIQDHDMNTIMNELKMNYGIVSIDQGIAETGKMAAELEALNLQLEAITVEISSAMEKYNHG